MSNDDFEELSNMNDSSDEESAGHQFSDFSQKKSSKNWGVLSLYLLPFVLLSFFFFGFSSWVSGDERFLIFGRGEGANLLTIGCEVVLEGKPVGEVVDVAFEEFDLVVSVELLQEFRDKLSINSRFVVSVLNAWSPGNVGIVLIPKQPSGPSDRLFSGADVKLELAPMANLTSRGYWLYGAVGVALVLLLLLYQFLKKFIVLVIGLVLIISGWYFARDMVDVSMIEELLSQLTNK